MLSSSTKKSGITRNSLVSNKMAKFRIFSNTREKFSFDATFAVLPSITCNLPQTLIDTRSLTIPNDITLADIDFFKPSQIDLLLGADVYYSLLCDGLISSGKDCPVLQNTKLGWIIAGNVPQRSSRVQTFSFLAPSFHTESEPLESLLTKFWELEELPNHKTPTPDEELAEQDFKHNMKFLDDGTVQVNLPLISENEPSKLGDSFHMAKKRLLHLENRFKNNPFLFSEYQKFIDEYISLGHARYVPLSLQNESLLNKYFLPHHCVIKKASSSTPLRVVFDASAKSSTGYSLNDITLKGFQVQPDLFDILCRFRQFSYVFTADITKMYRQIKLNPGQTFLQNILWRNTPSDPLKCIELSTVTYGTKSAPFLSTRTLKEIALTRGKNFPYASDALLTQTYVDDVMYGTDDLISLEAAHHELITLLKGAGFHSHKWLSNSTEFLEKISEVPQSQTFDIEIENVSSKVLGLSWRPIDDFFTISVPIAPTCENLTKRKALSIIAQMFDPLGLIGPVILLGKIFIQKLWKEKLDWDTPLPQTLCEEWKGFISTIPKLKDLEIPRSLCHKKKIVKIEIHGFADSSIKAYAACVYFRAFYFDNTVSCNLVTAKSRVSPVRLNITIPRLELQAMLLLANLTRKVISIFTKLNFASVNLWTDSQIALCWTQSHPSRWTTFVANRVSQIQEVSKGWNWRHIISADNAADSLSRGLVAQELLGCEAWWHGPRFSREISSYPSQVETDVSPTHLPEQRKVSLQARITPCLLTIFWENIFSRFSKFPRLLHTIAYCTRFLHNCKNPNSKRVGPLHVEEIHDAMNKIIENLQILQFPKELAELRSGKKLSNKNLLSLKPFLNKDGFLCVGGHLTHADIPVAQKHPILLPSNNNSFASISTRT